MTVSTTHVENTFTGNGATTAFAFTFHTLDTTHIEVLVNDVVQSTNDYAVSLYSDQEANPGGLITFDTAPAAAAEITIKRVTPLTQDVNFPLNARLNTGQLEGVFDKLTLQLQEAKARTQGEQGEQGPTGPQGAPGAVAGPVSSTNNALALWNGTGGNTLKNGPAPASNGDILQVVGGLWAATAAVADIPSGAMLLWDTNAAAVPTGWDLCDGRTVTVNGSPYVTTDTRGKYLMAAAAEDTGSSGYTGSTVRPGVISGQKTHQHANGGGVTIDTAYATGTVTISNLGITYGAAAGFNPAAAGTYNLSINGHAHTGSLSGNTGASVDSARPIEAAFLLIIKVDE